ncbi:hypothetical protein niasHT_014129 [Heterodera trifolii]|uniref:Uncharacterized protein n=1 Tax=Heterodera trifolii TaxID=157864 RepID=A0ABD2KXL5_9BILA
MVFLIWLLAFCLVVPIHFANAKVSPTGCPTSATDGIHLLYKNKTVVKPYNKDNASEIDGGDEDKIEIKQFLHELFVQYNTLAAILYKDEGEATAIDYSKIEAVLYHGDQKQKIYGQELYSTIEELVDGIKSIKITQTEKIAKNALLEGKEIVKIIEHFDIPTHNLLRKLHRSINDIIGIFNAGKIIQNAKLQNLKNAIVDTVKVLAKHMNISTNEIIQLDNNGPQIEPKNVLKELAQFWRHQKEQNGKNSKNSDEKRQYRQQNKRILKLIMDFTADGIDGLANLKMKKKSRGRRRRKRGGADKGFAIAFVVFLLGAFVIYCIVHYANKSKSNEDSTDAKSDIEAQIQPETREPPKRASRRPRSRSSSHSRERLRANLNHSSSRGDPDRNSVQWQLDVDHYSRNAAQETFEPPRDSNYHGDNERKGRKSRRENSQERKHRNNGRRRSGSRSRQNEESD